MKQNRNNDRGWGIVPVILVTLVLLKLFASYTHHIQERFDKINASIDEGTTIVLCPDANKEALCRIIYENGYCDSIKDAVFIADTLIERQRHERLKSLYSLQKRGIGQVSAHDADSCHVLDTILSISRDILGLNNNHTFDYVVPADCGSDSIVVVVEKVLENTSKFQLRSPKIKCSNVPVRLQLHHHNDSLENPMTLGYGWTDENGKVVFRGLFADSSYSVLPIQEGFEYGSSKGVVGGEWIAHEGLMKRMRHKIKNWINRTNDNEFRFVEKEHRIPLFTNTTLRLIKNEGSIIVRTPDEFRNELVKSRNGLLVSWWLLTLVLFLFPKRKPSTKSIAFLPSREFSLMSGVIVACCMFLSGLCILMMFSMVDPVNDELKGWDMTTSVLVGIGVAIALQFFDIVKVYQREKIPFLAWFEKVHLRGLGWLVLALLLTLLLFTPWGKSVGGMKVNLKLPLLPPFQPSEIAKYLIIVFSSIFFTENMDRIVYYSNEFDTNLRKKTNTLLGISAGLTLLLLFYFLLGDMGPGLVLGITFVLLYSFGKSKQDLRDEESVRWKKWLKCDFMMLVYGVVSYVLVLLLFHAVFKYWYISGTIVWLLVWIALGLFTIRKTPSGRYRPVFAKQVHETAIIMNLVIFVFILGSNAGKGNDSGVFGRLEERTNMCTNTWGGMDKVFHDIKKHDGLTQEIMSEPVSNTQVAHGLWALASGGFRGQGLGNGKPTAIPAYHTDMILSSIGEQMGWKGLLYVLIAYFVLVCLVAWKGIKTGEELSIFLCMGVAIVTAVQLFVIALGSAGVIPLTGVTVPLLSYGKVSMILNIAAFGLVLSLITKKDLATTDAEKLHEEVRAKNAETYSRPYLIPTICFAIGCIFTLCVWLKYQVFKRNRTLIQPAYVINREGNPELEYNPRIALVTNEMYAGRIFDRNGLLLATSNKEDISGAILDSLIKCGIETDELNTLKRRHLMRYYPFGDQLFFMVGNLNTRLFFSSPEDAPVGYMAEERHLSYLRGFDNVLYDKDHHPAQVRLVTNKKREDKYLQRETDTTRLTTLRDFSALLPYLKDGSGKKLEKHNNTVEKGKLDLYLTVDASLQKDIQDMLAGYMPNKYGNKINYHLMRVSVVVLNAKTGDLLASANYPQPDCDFLAKLKEKQEGNYYSDNNRDAKWMAYTDRDLGTTRQTQPGSTAKIMSAMAGLMKAGESASQKKYYVSPKNIVEGGSFPEPHGHDVTMNEAIVQSSNCYFINLVNDLKLYPELETIYKSIGVSIGDIVPYYYDFGKDDRRDDEFHKKVSRIEPVSYTQYDKKIKNNPKRNDYKMIFGEWQWAWGQGFGDYVLKASPLNMARLASAVVNEGRMPYTQYVIVKQKRNEQEKDLRKEGFVQLLSREDASILKNFMKKETENHKVKRAQVPTLPSYMGGKTGTAERPIIKPGQEKSVDLNDGWYMFFLEGDKQHDPLAVVVRMERGVGSKEAVRLAGNKLLGLLENHGYMQSPAR